jgi:hypothetical protein
MAQGLAAAQHGLAIHERQSINKQDDRSKRSVARSGVSNACSLLRRGRKIIMQRGVLSAGWS